MSEVSEFERAVLADPDIREALDGALAAEPEELLSRGSFAAYAEEVDT